MPQRQPLSCSDSPLLPLRLCMEHRRRPAWLAETKGLCDNASPERADASPIEVLWKRLNGSWVAVQWFTDFATAPPQEEPPDGVPLPYGQVHQGFERALGLESRATTLQPAEDVRTS